MDASGAGEYNAVLGEANRVRNFPDLHAGQRAARDDSHFETMRARQKLMRRGSLWQGLLDTSPYHQPHDVRLGQNVGQALHLANGVRTGNAWREHWSLREGNFEEEDDTEDESEEALADADGPLSRFVGEYSGVFEDTERRGRWRLNFPPVRICDMHRHIYGGTKGTKNMYCIPPYSLTCKSMDAAINMFLYRCAWTLSLQEFLDQMGGTNPFTIQKLFNDTGHLLHADYERKFQEYASLIGKELRALGAFHEKFTTMTEMKKGKQTIDDMLEVAQDMMVDPYWNKMFGATVEDHAPVQTVGYGRHFQHYIQIRHPGRSDNKVQTLWVRIS